jgi:transcriptional regulator of acetoin/glycerol metabolism
MKKLQLLPVGEVDPRLLDWLRQALFERFRVPTEILRPALDPAFALHAERQQFHSSEILAAMQSHINGDTWKLLGIDRVTLHHKLKKFGWNRKEKELAGIESQ